MAEFEAIEELLGEVEEGIADEAAETEGLEGEELEEVEAEAAAAREDIGALSNVVANLKTLGNLALSFCKYVGKIAFEGALFYGVTVMMKKMVEKDPNNSEAKQKYAKVKNISQFITSASDLSHKIAGWLKQNKDKMITLEGIQVPVISIFVKYTTPLENAADKEMENVKQLMKKTPEGKTTFSAPDAGQVAGVITNGQDLVDALRQFQGFAAKESKKFPVLQTLPMSKVDVDGLQQKLDAIKNMPF